MTVTMWPFEKVKTVNGTHKINNRFTFGFVLSFLAFSYFIFSFLGSFVMKPFAFDSRIHQRTTMHA